MAQNVEWVGDVTSNRYLRWGWSVRRRCGCHAGGDQGAFGRRWDQRRANGWAGSARTAAETCCRRGRLEWSCSAVREAIDW